MDTPPALVNTTPPCTPPQTPPLQHIPGCLQDSYSSSHVPTAHHHRRPAQNLLVPCAPPNMLSCRLVPSKISLAAVQRKHQKHGRVLAAPKEVAPHQSDPPPQRQMEDTTHTPILHPSSGLGQTPGLLQAPPINKSLLRDNTSKAPCSSVRLQLQQIAGLTQLKPSYPMTCHQYHKDQTLTTTGKDSR